MLGVETENQPHLERNASRSRGRRHSLSFGGGHGQRLFGKGGNPAR